MDILVSIVTVVYNGAATIKDTMESVLNQTYKNIEYIIVDGLSTDGSLEIINSYKDRFKEKGIDYKVISEKDSGIYDAMNKGISLAKGTIVGLINSDDWYELDAVEKVVKTYIRTNFDYFFGDIRIINGNKHIIKRAKLRKHYITSRDWNHPTSFVTKDIYDKYQYKNETIYDDFDLFLRIRKDNRKVIVLNEVLANFRVGGLSNQKNIAKTISRMKQRYTIYRNNKYSKIYFLECFFVETIKYIIT